ncbi:hypothetical protein J3459_010298 [Metarhizium acridum]|uniref:uncharacterized protein n=1 Tax=Metarhizium acridum TaxID=92637 RepID=UPI001C6C1CD3|nr:hypothetical protein J3459_010298 [Metarhizium acridum]KAG8425408.1 hypothetical protein J3458_002110 [Metarhizium acridum]
MDRPEWQVNVNEEIASPVYRIRLPIVALLEMEQKVKQAIQPLTRSWEMNFLPLWAGGLNDGTGAVFESHIPSTDMGPNGPGPAYHAGHTIPSAPPSISDSLVDDIFAMKVTSTPTSGTIDSHDDMSIVYRDDKAIVDDVSIKTESFQTAESDYDGARFAVPAGHQEIAETVNSLVEAVDDFEADTQETPVASDYESDSDGSVVLVKRACGE